MKVKVALALTVTFFIFASSAQAAVVTVDVTIKVVNPQARGITVVYDGGFGEKTIELDVSRKAEISLNGKDAALDSLGSGVKAKVSFDKDLAVVTKIEATGVVVKHKPPELIEVSELNDGEKNDHPWPSEDGLTIYWDRSAGRKGSIWTARRENLESPFDNKASLFSGQCPTVSSDGLELILAGDRTDGAEGKALQVATRQSVDQRFKRPKELRELDSHIAWVPCLSPDGLTLYFSSRVSRGNATAVYCTRKNKSSPWSTPRSFVDLTANDPNALFSFLTVDGLAVLGSIGYDLSIWRRSSTTRRFGEGSRIDFNNRPLSGMWPRHVAKTNELFFASRAPLKAGPPDKGLPPAIWVVKNFKLPQAGGDR